MPNKWKVWNRNLISNVFWLLVSLIPAWLGYKEYMELKTKDVVYIINDIIPIPGELVMVVWFILAVIIAYLAVTGIIINLKIRFK